MPESGEKNGAHIRKFSIFEKPVDLDYILVNELGQFGWYQIRNVLLLALATISSAFYNEYVFSAAAIPHRCRISECGESTKSHPFDPDWITNAIPETNSTLASCERYVWRNTGVNGTLDSCSANLFDATKTVGCDAFVYARNNSIVYDFDLGCQDWLRALAGTLNSVGSLLVLPLTGYISDRYGRKVVLIIGIFNLSLFGVLKAFSVNYTMYLIMQIVQTTLGASIFSSTYIFVTEMVGPEYRVFMSAIQSSLFASGMMLIGAVAWAIQPWRHMLMVLHIPCFLMLSYHWLLPESVRWLLSKQKYKEVKILLEKAARLNKTQISEKSMESLMNPKIICETEEETPSLIRSVVNSTILLRRVCITSIWWLTTIMVYFGLSIESTDLSETMYLNYIITCAVEIPGFFTAVLLLNKIGRRATLVCGYFLSAACNIAFIFIPSDFAAARLVIFLLGKFGISGVFTSVYLYTSELYPTEFRHTLMSFSSMIGRLGAIVAPLMPVLSQYWQGTPSAVFGGMAVISGLLVLTQPETLGTKLPDTLAEAEAIGTPGSKL